MKQPQKSQEDNQKESNPLIELVKKHLITFVLSILVVAWTFVKDAVLDSADHKFNESVKVIVITDKDIKAHFDSIIDSRFTYNLKQSLNNPMLWFDALNSNFVSAYAEEKASDIREEVQRKLLEVDSIQKGFVESIGKGLGIRDEDVLPLFEKMMKDYVKKNEPRIVTATF